MNSSLERLWSPWRSKYIESFSNSEVKTCIFCDALSSDDDEARFILWRGNVCFVILNVYPYNAGHVMVVPNRHVPSIEDLTDAESAEIMSATRLMLRGLTKAIHPHGFNFGANIGRVSGAGIDDHIHFHIVPRWNGDTNFMPVLSETKVISEELCATYHKLKLAIQELKKENTTASP